MSLRTALRGLLPGRPAPRVEPSPRGRPRLVLAAGDEEGTVGHDSPAADDVQLGWALGVGRLVLGSAPDADLVLDLPEVAGHHAELVVSPNGAVLVRSWQSSVAVNGVPTAEAQLVDGSRLQVGSAVLVLREEPLQPHLGRQGGELGEHEPLPPP